MPQVATQPVGETEKTKVVRPPVGSMTCPKCMCAQVGLALSGVCSQCGWTWPRAREVTG